MTTAQASSKDAQVLIPVMDVRLARLLDDRGVLRWSFNHTLAATLLGRERAEKAWKSLFISPKFYGLNLFLYILFVASVIIVMALGVFQVVPKTPMIICAVFSFLGIGVFDTFLTDLRIMNLLVRNGSFWANIVLAAVGFVSVGFFWNFDYRCSLVPVYLQTVLLTSSIDAVNPRFKFIIGIPALSLVLVVIFAVLVLINISRLPGTNTSPNWFIGDFDGIATRPLILSPNQLATDALVGHGTFILRSLVHLIRTRKVRAMYTVTAQVATEDDPTFDHFEGMPVIQRDSKHDEVLVAPYGSIV